METSRKRFINAVNIDVSKMEDTYALYEVKNITSEEDERTEHLAYALGRAKDITAFFDDVKGLTLVLDPIQVRFFRPDDAGTIKQLRRAQSDLEDAIKSVDSGLAVLGTNHTQNLNRDGIEAAAVQADQLLSQGRGTFSIEALPQIPVYVVYSPDPDGGADTILGYATGNLDGIAAYYGDNCKAREIKILAIDEHAVDARIALMSEKTRLGHLLEQVTAAHANFGL